MNTKSSESYEVTLRGVTMRRNDSDNFRTPENLQIEIYCLYQNEKVIVEQKLSATGWGYHASE